MTARVKPAAIAAVAAAELMDLVADRAPKLRAAGVAILQLGDLVVHLHQHQGELGKPEAPAVAEDPDPLQDPATFGRKSGVPGYERRELDPGDDEDPDADGDW